MTRRSCTPARAVVVIVALLVGVVVARLIKRRAISTLDTFDEELFVSDEQSVDLGDSLHSSSWRSVGSLGSARSIGSIGSFCSIGSIGSSFSIGSIGSSFSIGSIGSFVSIASIASAASIGSFASVGACFSSRAFGNTKFKD